jgi:hypothetical protein
MEIVQLSIALLTAGVALFAGLVSLFIGLYKDGEKTDLFFGLLCIAIFIYFLAPPVGFITVDRAPFSFEIIFKRIFNFFFFSIFPWFVFYYTGYKKKALPYHSLTPEQTDKLIKASFDNTISLDKLNSDYYDKMKKAVGAVNAAKYMQLEIYLQTMWKAVVQSNIPLIGQLDKTKQN